MKKALLAKFNENLSELEKAETEQDRSFFYVYLKGFLSAIFELPEFTQTEIEDMAEQIDQIERKVWLRVNCAEGAELPPN